MAATGRPSSTYRLQLGEHLGFDDARTALPYLRSLGIGALYLSPILAAAGGGGYHVTDPTAIDAALGGPDGFDRLAEEARGLGMGIVVDIVPNHMKASEENRWWADVLARGRGSPYAGFFDVDWSRHDGKILLPVLEEPGSREEGEHVIRAYWRDGLRELNYRRFFDIADLVCLRQEDPEVFEATHRTILDLVGDGKVTGLRVDHVDGLRDPQGYLERLRAAAPDALVLVEKILAPGERLPEAWPVDGTTGYEVGDAIIGVLTDPAGAAACDRLFQEETGAGSFPEVLFEAKRQVLSDLFAGEVDRLVRTFRPVAGPGAVADDDLRAAIVSVTAALRVYRTYVRDGSGPDPEDRARVEEAVEGAGSMAPARAVEAVARVLRDPGIEGLDAVLDWQQLSGPAMAKGHEDTALYRSTALVSRNEVGGDPGAPPPTPQAFHAAMAGRAERCPPAHTATSTHDTKRGEDVRARIAALSETPEAWGERARAWRQLAADGRRAPAAAEEDLLLFQTLLGAWPLEGGPDRAFVRRIQEAMVKSAREAKRATSWLDPDEAHEEALRETVERLVEDPRFLESFLPFQERISLAGAVNALAQVVLKTSVPGIPDLYQGTESWHLRLVDPDNRIPVDLGHRAELLRHLDARSADLPALADEALDTWRDGRVKLLVTAAALRLRATEPGLFEEGAYLPLSTHGQHADRVLALARRRGDEWALAAVPRLAVSVGGAGWPLGEAWGDTWVRLPDEAPSIWSDALAGQEIRTRRRRLELWEAFRRLPVALLSPRRLASGGAAEAPRA